MYVRRVLVTQRGRSGFEVYTEPVTSPYMQTFLVVFALEMRHQVELNAYTHAQTAPNQTMSLYLR